MLVGGTQTKAQATKFDNEIQIEDLQLMFSDDWMRHFLGPIVKKGLSLHFHRHSTLRTCGGQVIFILAGNQVKKL